MKSNTKYQWMLPLGSMVAASIIVVGAWFAVGALRPDTAVEEIREVAAIEVVDQNDEVHEVAAVDEVDQNDEGQEVAAVDEVDQDDEVYEITVTSLSLNVYPTLEVLSESADAVILGEVKGAVHTGISFGTDGTDGTGGIRVPYTLYEVEVHETFKGDASGAIYVARTDPSFLGEAPGVADYPLTTLGVGEAVILYLYRVSPVLEPTMPSGLTDTIYYPLGFDNGVFDVSANGPVGAVGRVNDSTEVIPRGIDSAMFAEGSVFTAADIRQAIEPESGEEGPVGSTN